MPHSKENATGSGHFWITLILEASRSEWSQQEFQGI